MFDFYYYNYLNMIECLKCFDLDFMDDESFLVCFYCLIEGMV